MACAAVCVRVTFLLFVELPNVQLTCYTAPATEYTHVSCPCNVYCPGAGCPHNTCQHHARHHQCQLRPAVACNCAGCIGRNRRAGCIGRCPFGNCVVQAQWPVQVFQLISHRRRHRALRASHSGSPRWAPLHEAAQHTELGTPLKSAHALARFCQVCTKTFRENVC